ncbi:hypothetical protein RIF29_12360 [Crotalaria pallida]|uniref:Uncharacterized protein n=1 Tax=Crotalaria pallida TaxID=3830 RepID=A0AAN9P1P2_CROPI
MTEAKPLRETDSAKPLFSSHFISTGFWFVCYTSFIALTSSRALYVTCSPFQCHARQIKINLPSSLC